MSAAKQSIEQEQIKLSKFLNNHPALKTQFDEIMLFYKLGSNQ